jgi:hypothetical protein
MTELNPKPKKSLVKIIWRVVTLFIRKWNEAIILFPIAILSWCFAPVVINWIDPTAAIYDTGILMKFMYAVIGTIICHFTAWLMLRLTFPTTFRYLFVSLPWDIYDSPADVKSTERIKYEQCKRIKYSLVLFSLYVFTFIAILFTV